MKTNDLLLYGAIGVGAYLLLSKNNSSAIPVPSGGVTTTPSTPLNSILSIPQNIISNLTGSAPSNGIPPKPAVFDMNYYLTYEYPAMLAQNPNVGNPNYVLSDNEANQYLNNYADLRGTALQSWTGGTNLAGKKNVSHKQGTDGILDKARAHWQQYGVPDKRSFMAFTPTNSNPQTAPPMPPVPVAQKGGSNIFGDILKGVEVVGPYVAAALAGIPDLPLLSANEVEILVTGGGIILDVLPFYFESPVNGEAATQMYNDYETLITQYT